MILSVVAAVFEKCVGLLKAAKSGGVRVIYYRKKSDYEIWMLTIYSKSEQATIPGHILKKIVEAIENE